VLLLRLLQLQVVEGPKYKELSGENAAKTVPAPAPRGVVYDRNGKILVENRPIFSVQVMPQLRKGEVLKKLESILGEKIVYKISADRPIIIKDDIKLETAVRIEERKNELEGVVVSVRPVRYYPHGDLAAHLLGYVGEIETDELKRLKEEGYRLGDSVGKDGIEKYYDKLVRGVDGGKKIEVDVRGTPRRLLESLEPVPGANVKLTVDLELQMAAEKALMRSGRPGAVVILDPRSGEVLALASRPDYDPNLSWRALSAGSFPFVNRALAIYPPGSTFKAITLTAALQEKVAKPTDTIYCPGYYRVNNRIAKCWKGSGHGRITVAEGLTQSCDVVFYELGRRLGPDRLADYARRYGLGERTGIDIPQEKKGLVPTPEWKKKVWGEPWYEGDSINYGIGQGFLQVTPLQMALVYGEIATGKRMRPFIVSEIKNREGDVLYQAHPQEEGSVPLSNENLRVVREALKNVVARATGIAARVPGLPAAGKTGTAENPGLPHAWFLCYAPYDNPVIVIAAFVEHGQHGDRSAAYVARDILTWYRDNRMPKKEGEEEIIEEEEEGSEE
jgi:penicillin-binding protein 2